MSQGFSTVIEPLRSVSVPTGRALVAALSFVACSRTVPPLAADLERSNEKPERSAPKPAPAWFENDYRGALEAARERGIPVFVDASAVWCHTCLAMRAFVLDDPALEKSAFVWFSFDVEGPGNEAVAARFPAKVLPTFFVVDPSNESVHGRWEGAATVGQMRQFLSDGRRSIELS
ncbi:MAG TPA: thioredoxin family protein, partial [Polyangiaceae bacterium]